jgi:hypothetical protein
MKALPLWIALAFGATVPLAKGETPEQMWKGFREAHPFHLQVVALSRPEHDGSRVLIVSEPPGHVTPDGLRKCSACAFTLLKVKNHEIGYDGFVRDVVAKLPAMSEPQVAELIDRLHDYMFGTTYKAEALTLPFGPLPPAKDLAIKVSAEEIRMYVLDEKESFRAVEGGKPQSLASILSDRKSGVFLSRNRGLVAWTLPRGVGLNRHRARARQFAVDSDLILGAVAVKDHLAIIGRERVAPVRILPPLRVEMLVTLAAVGSSELGQSYDRTRLFAGRFDKEWDWAPIFLSPELIDTEYGSLLNITDQLLKGWTSSGMVEYKGFKYHDPSKFPFRKPLILELKGGSLTYNWNTAGAGYTVERDGVEVFALNHTGSLPVSYIPGESATTKGHEETAEYEHTAYDYFSGLGDPNLVRVTQYAAAYQIFQKFGRRDAKPSVQTIGQVRGNKVLAEAVRRALDDLRNSDADKVVARLLGEKKHDEALKDAVKARVVALRAYPDNPRAAITS